MRIAITPIDKAAYVVFSPETRVTWNADGEVIAERDTTYVFATDGSGVLLSGFGLNIQTRASATA